MITLKQHENEDRKNHLIRVTIEILMSNAYVMETINYDEAECDALSLAEDLKIEFDLS